MEKQVLFFRACCCFGLMKIGRWLIQQSEQRVIILNYHRASGGDLRNHLLYFHRHYRIMHLEEALKELYTPDKDKKLMRDRRTRLVLTFDDGYRDNYTHAFALANELQVPITVFLVSGYIESNKRFWWLEGDQLVSHAQVAEVTVAGHTYDLTKLEDRNVLVLTIYNRLFYATSVAMREAFLKEMREALKVSSEYTEDSECVLTWEEIHKMEESGWVSFGAHTLHHPVLAELSDPLEVQDEVSDCKTILQQQLGHQLSAFAYPLGRTEHIGEEALQAVQKAGYNWAVTTIQGINTCRDNPLLLRRIEANVNWHWLLLAAETSGVASIFLPLFPYGRALLAVGGRSKAILWVLLSTYSRRGKVK